MRTDYRQKHNAEHVKPHFFVIGAMKSGSTSLHAYLAAHPELNMSIDKEINYFSIDHNFNQGPEWYGAFFKKGMEAQLLGETSVTYSMKHLYPHTAQRIYDVCGPHTKFIYLERNPVERILSHFKHNKAAGRIHIGLNDWMNTLHDQSHEVLTSMAAFQLMPFVELFGKEQILVVASSQLSTDRKTALKNIFGFLGVDSSFESPVFNKEKHLSKGKLHFNAYGRLLGRVPVLWRYREKLPFAGKKVNVEVPSAEQISRLEAFFGQDRVMLADLLGVQYPHNG